MLSRLQTAIRGFYSCNCKHVASVPVIETERGSVVWTGHVEVFDLMGHKFAKQCYGWEQETPEGGVRIVTILRQTPILSPLHAVQASLRARKSKLYWRDQDPM